MSFQAWERLERAEHERELALRQELIRQEKLEQLAARFDRKAAMRETWLSENQRLVAQDNFGYDLPSVEAAAKKHEAIETDIYAYQERVLAVVAVAQELEEERYHDIERVNARWVWCIHCFYYFSLNAAQMDAFLCSIIVSCAYLLQQRTLE